MQEEKLIEALHLAKSIMDICGGDAWERECTEEDRGRFGDLYDELFPQPKAVDVLSRWDTRCDVCGIVMPKNNYMTHLNGKRHKQRLAEQRAADERSIAS
jgi:hypothetical protein